MGDVVLNEDQQTALDYATEGHNLFITGPAGTGKSLTISKIVEALSDMGKTVYVTASTGIAASLLSGSLDTGVRTFHGWAGIGLGKYAAHSHAKFIMKNENAKERILKTDVVILDEVSMMDAEYMDKVNAVLQLVRKSQLPFGGIQIITSGDFFQLPPPQKGRKEPLYLFQVSLWDKLVEKTVVLSKVYRQSKQEFIDMLTKIRNNHVDGSVWTIMNRLAKNELRTDTGIKPTTLYCRNANVDNMNANELRMLEGKAHFFRAREHYKDEDTKKEQKESFSLVSELFLKKGAQVMCLLNLSPEDGIVNGSRGVVTHIHNTKAPSATWLEEDKCAKDYVRVRFLNGHEHSFSVEKQEVKDEFGEVVAWKEQFPFKLSWALTIHKSQGASIDLLDVDLAGCFAPGQAYVAISRGTNLETMRVRNFTRDVVITSPEVMKFQQRIECQYKPNKRPHEDEDIFDYKRQKT